MKIRNRVLVMGSFGVITLAGLFPLIQERSDIYKKELAASLASENTVESSLISLPKASQLSTTTEIVNKPLVLPVPFVPEAPDGNWTGPWKDACEESSIAMVENYYNGVQKVDIADAKQFMSGLFTFQDERYRSNMNSNTKRLLEMIEEKTSFGGTIVTNPTIDDIKHEIDLGHPVLSFHRGSELKNPNIAFLASGSSFHVLVVIGYDDVTREFITHDPGDRREGEGHRYGYDLFMKSLHDYNFSNYSADGPARIVTTFPIKAQ